MSKPLPPLNALRAFEAAGRHLSVSRAAAELHVTPAAVSHQIKSLETYLGVKLFRRTSRSLLLTDAGQACLPGLRTGFEYLAGAVEAARTFDGNRPLAVTVAPTFAVKWLVPRLDRFAERNPEIDIRLDASPRLFDMVRDEFDIAIRYGRGDYPGYEVERLFEHELFPVCSPKLAQARGGLHEPSDLCRFTLLHLDTPDPEGGGAGNWPDWRMWLLAAGVTECDARRGPRFSFEGLTVQAAIDGQGVALASNALVENDLAAGRLIRPFELSFPTSFGYYLVYPHVALARPRVRAFRDWVVDEVERTHRT